MNIPGKKKNKKSAEELAAHAGEKLTPEQQEMLENFTEESTSEPEEPPVNWKEKYDESQDQYLRLYAEFENFRRRSARERQDLILSAGSDVLKSLLPVLDDFDRALENIRATDSPPAVLEGIELITSKLNHLLAEKGLKEMDVLGTVFDADVHEAITHLPASNPEEKGKIMAVAEKGYTLNEKIIRYPKVVVAS